MSIPFFSMAPRAITEINVFARKTLPRTDVSYLANVLRLKQPKSSKGKRHSHRKSPLSPGASSRPHDANSGRITKYSRSKPKQLVEQPPKPDRRVWARTFYMFIDKEDRANCRWEAEPEDDMMDWTPTPPEPPVVTPATPQAPVVVSNWNQLMNNTQTSSSGGMAPSSGVFGTKPKNTGSALTSMPSSTTSMPSSTASWQSGPVNSGSTPGPSILTPLEGLRGFDYRSILGSNYQSQVPPPQQTNARSFNSNGSSRQDVIHSFSSQGRSLAASGTGVFGRTTGTAPAPSRSQNHLGFAGNPVLPQGRQAPGPSNLSHSRSSADITSPPGQTSQPGFGRTISAPFQTGSRPGTFFRQRQGS